MKTYSNSFSFEGVFTQIHSKRDKQTSLHLCVQIKLPFDGRKKIVLVLLFKSGAVSVPFNKQFNFDLQWPVYYWNNELKPYFCRELSLYLFDFNACPRELAPVKWKIIINIIYHKPPDFSVSLFMGFIIINL